MKGKRLMRTLAALTLSVFAGANFGTVAANATTMDNLQATSTKQTSSEDLERKIVGYFPEWAYASKVQGYFDVADLQWDELTHIQYSFCMVDPATNKIAFGDKHAAIEEDFADHPIMHKGKEIKLDSSLPYKGHFNIIQTMKKMYPDVKVVMSVGGWAGSRGFYTMMDTDEGINTFADSCVDFIRQYGFDGIDIDFEYPSSTATCGNPADADVSEPRRATINERYNVLMKTLNEKLDAAGVQDNKDYVFSAAVTASSWVLGGVSDNSYAKELDFLSVMSYDFHGGWNEYVENLANIYPDPADTETIQMAMPTLCMEWAYNFYRGVLPSEKILMGIPYYTRGWENVQGGNGTGLHGKSKTPASGVYNLWGDDDDGNGEPDPAGANPLWHVLNLMENDKNFNKYYDQAGGVPYVWQSDDKVFLSFEDEQSIQNRVDYVKEKNLGGVLIWVMNGDYGLNDNYVPGSTDPNEGKYTFGNTLTKKLSDGFKAIGPCTVSDDFDSSDKGFIDVDVDFSGKYDHPNYTFELVVTNKTGEAIDAGWEVSFDLPKSSIFTTLYGGSYSTKDNGDFNTVTIQAPGWATLPAGGSQKLSGCIKLCFSGIRNLKFNGYNVGEDPTKVGAPTISGAENQTINMNSSFNALAGVTAKDDKDGDLTSKIQVSSNVNTAKGGKYTVTYSVTNSAGQTTTKTITVTVVNPDAPEWDSTVGYKKGEKVTYEGNIYECTSWWALNQVPSANSSYWQLVEEQTPVDPSYTITDLANVASKYNTKSNQAGWVASYDKNSDGVIDIFDLVLVAKYIK